MLKVEEKVAFQSLKQIEAGMLKIGYAGGIGHNLPQEAPQAFVQVIIDVNPMKQGGSHATAIR